MDSKILIYLTAALLFYLYKTYQKLQQEALERKSKMQPVKSIEMETPLQKKVFKVEAKPKVKLKEPYSRPVVNRSIAKVAPPVRSKIMSKQNSSVEVMERNSEHIESENNLQTVEHDLKPSFQFDLKQMIIYSTVLQKPAYLNY